ncbi:MAG: superoxide dismutase family protein, partial [Gemmatimonadaceae bacterium]
MTMSRSLVFRGLALSLVAAFVGCVHGHLNRVAVAYATFESAGGEPRGTAVLWQDPSNLVHVELQLSGLPPGEHGIHFHAVGKCEGGATPFATAGGHYNPLGREHGLSNPQGPHAGDAPNITVAADGTAKTSFTTDRVSLTAGSTALFD